MKECVVNLAVLGLLFLRAAVASEDPTEGARRVHPDRVPITGVDNPDLRPLDQLMTGMLRDHGVPGASLAVVRKGVLVYARGFGLADVEKEIPVLPTTRFRIASLSKPITAAAVLSLVNDGKLGLDDRLLRFMSPSIRSSANPQVRKITIRQLLRHRAGWDRNVSWDPMFETVRIGKALGLDRPANQQEIIAYMLRRPLDFEAGSRYAYSNFGYCLLGRVIERVSGMPYGQYVQRKILRPLGLKSPALARTLRRAPGEVKYYARRPELVPGVVEGVVGDPVPRQYGGWCIENMDSHGGWIASAPDLAIFACALDHPEKTNFLNNDLAAQMFSPAPEESAAEVFYGLGWQVRRLSGSRGINTWHTGSLTGTSTLLVRRYDGLSWAVLFNMRDSAGGKKLASIVDPLVHRAANRVRRWPTDSVPVE